MKKLKSWLSVVNAGSDNQSAELLIIGQIGASWWEDSGVKEKEFRAALATLPVGRKVTIGINSEGGSVKDGLESTTQSERERMTSPVASTAMRVRLLPSSPLLAGKLSVRGQVFG
jgi:hypothetical protein